MAWFPRSDWQTQGVCSDEPNLFFASPGERPERRRRRERAAKAVCLTCPVIAECREAGRQHREHGVWGGETEEERAALGYLPRRASRRLIAIARQSGTIAPAAQGEPRGDEAVAS